MRILGFNVARAPRQELVPAEKALPPTIPTSSLSPVDGGWWRYIREAFAGAWQKNVETPLVDVMTYSTVFACVTLIAGDIAKMRLRLVQEDSDGIWNETFSAAFSPVLRRPNHYQNRIKFVEQWILSKLIHGNAYILKERDNRNVIQALYPLDPTRVRPLVAANGEVYYQISQDHLSGVIEAQITVPATEVIHDTMYALYHPLVGLPPIYACGLSAMVGLKIQNNTANLFANGATPSGILTAPGAISDAQAKTIKDRWDASYTGVNAGKVAVLGNGLKFEPMVMRAVDAQLIEQLKWTSESVCSAFHVPPYMVGVGPPPNYNNIQALSVQYFTQCIQSLVEPFELVLDEGLALPDRYGVEFNVEDLLRMDSATMMDMIAKGVGAGVFAPNDGRKKVNLKPVPGGEQPYLQQQNFSLEALAKRDAMGPASHPQNPNPNNPPSPQGGKPPAEPPPPAKGFDIAAFEASVLRGLTEAA